MLSHDPSAQQLETNLNINLKRANLHFISFLYTKENFENVIMHEGKLSYN